MAMKRFIAGAICPNCQSLDKIAVLKLPDQMIMECTACGHTVTMNKRDVNHNDA